MFALGYNITIGGLKFSGVYEVEVKRSISSLVGTAKVKVPSTAVLKKTDGSRLNILTAQQIKRGDAVEIELGYNGLMVKEFSGYVSRINYTQPLEIECEDGAFLLREKSIAKKYKNTDLKTVLTDILKDVINPIDKKQIEFSTGDISLNIETLLLCTENGGAVTRIDALQNVVERYGLIGYFDVNQKLFVGLRQGNKTGKVKLKLGWNTIKDDELKYHNSEEQKVKITAVYVNKLGKRTEVKVGDNDGASRTVFLTDVADETQLKQLAQNELDKYKFDGYAGKLTTFLQPFCDAGYVIELTDPQYSSRNGSYFCEGVEVAFGTGGARRKIEIGAKSQV